MNVTNHLSLRAIAVASMVFVGAQASAATVYTESFPIDPGTFSTTPAIVRIDSDFNSLAWYASVAQNPGDSGVGTWTGGAWDRAVLVEGGEFLTLRFNLANALNNVQFEWDQSVCCSLTRSFTGQAPLVINPGDPAAAPHITFSAGNLAAGFEYAISWQVAGSGPSHQFLLDNFSISGDTVPLSVPEPETYAMLLAGLGLVGAMGKRAAARREQQSNT